MFELSSGSSQLGTTFAKHIGLSGFKLALFLCSQVLRRIKHFTVQSVAFVGACEFNFLKQSKKKMAVNVRTSSRCQTTSSNVMFPPRHPEFRPCMMGNYTISGWLWTISEHLCLSLPVCLPTFHPVSLSAPSQNCSRC